ncbi:hypothetical protein WDU94_011748, partial [Cyamophila willieti]
SENNSAPYSRLKKVQDDGSIYHNASRFASNLPGNQSQSRRNGDLNKRPNIRSQRLFDSTATSFHNSPNKNGRSFSPNMMQSSSKRGRSHRVFPTIRGRFDPKPKYEVPMLDKSKTKLGFEKLEQLSKDQDSLKVAVELANTYNGLEYLLGQDVFLKERPDWIILITRNLAKVCSCDFPENKVKVLNVLFESQFIDSILHCLHKLSSSSDKQRTESFLNDIHILLETLIDTFPTSSTEKLHSPVQQVFAAISCMEQFEGFPLNESIKTKFTKLDSRLRELKSISEKLLDKNKKLDDGEPPEDFRTFELFPTEEEIRCKRNIFLRRNIVNGGYRDVEHYLDVQFRLLREDLMMPLREGFSELVEKLSRYERGRMKINHLRYFEHCSFLSVTTDHGTISYDVCFDMDRKLNHINWEYNQWFKYGSLVFFSFDNFSSFLVGKVAEKNNKTCRMDRIISVELIGTKELQAHEWGKQVRMVESTIFFQPYYHVMKALVNFKESNFPLTRYIVDVKSDILPPVYLQESSILEIDGFTFDVLDDSAWPSADKLCLNEFQYEAFKAALTQEFVIMQGPPGTGKTFLGLKIVEALVKLKSKCVPATLFGESISTLSSPIIVVCYTNHALDQFLEGILKFTQNVVRVGSMTKSDAIKPYELSQVRFRCGDRGVDSAYLTLKNQMKDIITQVKTMKQNLMNIEERKGILKLGYLARFMSPAHQNQLGTDEKLVQWLLMRNDFVLDDRYNEFEYKNSEENGNGETEVELVESDSEDEIRREFQNEKFVLEMGMDVKVQENVHAVHLEQLDQNRLGIEERCIALEYNFNDAEQLDYAWTRWNLQAEYQAVCYSIDTILEQHEKMNHFSRIQNVDTLSSNLVMLNIDERWKLYSQWVSHLKSGMMNSMKALEKKYRDQSQQFQETQQLQDLYVLRKFDIIGITTTAAAKNHNLLSALKPNIVIVEEAAEVLEAHIVTALTDHCQHLILIGDHQQLRPNPNVYRLAKQYNLEISLFERMINNKLNFSRLGIQHRMRPEICELITPSIYPNLQNHPSVYKFDDVRGITKNLFFVTHEVDEEKDDTIQSFKNPHEGNFVLELAQYLLLQGYSSDEITILTTYSGQLIYMKMEKKNMPKLSDVRLTTVDNYQGEECEIILLSLVRSNPEDKIGFLATSNRVCVALSRAKKGFYLIGNMKALETSEIWKLVKNKLEQQKETAIGSQLELKCSIHGNSTFVKEKSNFLSVAEGGCSIICGTPLNCGHNCVKLCHSYDLTHESYLCRETCKKICPEGHPCTYQCYQCRETCQPCKITMKNFALACGHFKDIECYQIKTYKCEEKVEANIERCGHNALVPCYQVTSARIICPKPCDLRLACGHQCTLTCHYDEDPDHIEFKCKKKCERLKKGCSSDHYCKNVCSEPCPVCNEEVMKKLPCGHSQKGLCHLVAMECLQICNKTLDCGHPCKQLCKDKCGGCNVLVEKTIPECGHKVSMKCKINPITKLCHNPCQKLLTCGHLCSKKCNEACIESNECSVLVEITNSVPLCSHGNLKVPCKYATLSGDNLQVLALKYCTEPCTEVLLCGHTCTGTCSECQQKRYHKICNRKCERLHLCGHGCKQDCSSVCLPCEARCSSRCRHKTCKLSCREKCTKCYDECPWKCEHGKCSSECSDMCRRRRCYQPCRNELPCGHECIGYCGEPCPDKCRVCDEDEVQVEYFGFEKEKDARFVVLEDCGHFFESKGIELYLGVSSNSNTEIVMKTCPKCKKPIVSTLRFMNAIRFIKYNMQDAKKRQKMVLGERPIPEQKIDLIQRIKKMEDLTLVNAGSKHFSNIQRNLLNELEDYFIRTKGFNKHQKKSKFVTVDQLRLFTFIVDCMECLESGFSHVNTKVTSRMSTVLILNHVDEILMSLMNIPNNKISQQLKYDFYCGINRLYALMNLLSLKSNYQNFEYFQNKDTLTQIQTKCMEELGRLDKFDKKLSNHFESMLNELRAKVTSSIPTGMTFDQVKMIKPDATLWNDAHGTKVRVFMCFSSHMYHVVQTGSEDVELETPCPDCARRGDRPQQNQTNTNNTRQYQIGEYQSSSLYGQYNRSDANTRQRNQRYEPNYRQNNNRGKRRGRR